MLHSKHSINENNYKEFGRKMMADVIRYSSEDVAALTSIGNEIIKKPLYKIAKKGAVSVWERKVPGSGINLIRAETVANTTGDVLLAWMCEPGFLQDLDSNFLEPKVVLKTFDALHEITYYKYGLSGPVAKRDFVTFEANSKEGEGYYVTAACTVEFPGKPPVKDLVRADIWTSGYVLRDLEGGKCHVTYIMHGSPRGYIPQALVNLAQIKQPFVAMCRIRERFLTATPRSPSARAALPSSPSSEKLVELGEEKKDQGNAFTLMFEDLMKHPQVMEKVMNLDVVKRLLKEPETFRRVIRKFKEDEEEQEKGEKEGKTATKKKSNAMELFDDPEQFHEILDLIISESVSLEELNDFLKEVLGLDDGDVDKNADKDAAFAEEDELRGSGGRFNPYTNGDGNGWNGNGFGKGVYHLSSLEKQKQIVEATYVDPLDEGRNRVQLSFKVFNASHVLNYAPVVGTDEEAMKTEQKQQEDEQAGTNLAFAPTPQQLNMLDNLRVTGASNVEQWSIAFNLDTCCVQNWSAAGEKGSSNDDAEEGTKKQTVVLRRLKDVWTRVVKRHPALRILLLKQAKRKQAQKEACPAQLAATQSSWWQVLPAKPAELAWHEFDWTKGAADWTAVLARDRMDELDSQKADSLMRFAVFLLPAGEIRFLWSFHAALLDPSSVERIARQVVAEALFDGRQPALLELGALKPLSPVERSQQLQFWHKHLSDFKAPTPLFLCKPLRNVDLKRKKSGSLQVGSINFGISEEIASKFWAKAKAYDIPPDTIVLAIWSFLLSRCSGGEKRVLFGLCKRSATDTLPIGCHQPVLPLLVDLEAAHVQEETHARRHKKHALQSLPLWSFLRGLGERIGEIAEFAQRGKECLTLAEIQKQSEVPEEYRLFNSLLVLDTTPSDRDLDAWFKLANFLPHWNYPLVLHARIAEGELSFTLIYEKTHIADRSADRLSGYFRTLLEGISAAPSDQDAHELPMLPYEEQHHLVVGCHKNYAPYPNTVRVEQLFERQVKQTPDRIAIEFEERTVTYQQLDDEANRMARLLVSKGLEGETSIVALYMIRDISLVVSMLAIVKAGAAYLPLDPRTPKERVHVILQDAGARGVICNEEKAKYLFEGYSSDQMPFVYCVDKPEDQKCLASMSSAPLDESVKQKHHHEGLMYIIYTSGSTGKPKGVRICHRSLINQFTYIAKKPGMTERDRILGVSTISFDIAQLELVMPLTLGARILMVSADVARDGLTLKNLLESNSSKNRPHDPLTIVQATPASWRMLCAAGWEGDSERLSLWCGGEAMTCDLAKQLLPRCLGLFNMYGPTETTVWGSVLKVSATDHVGPHSSTIPVGGPVDNSQFFVLDQHRQLVPKGVLGELYIAGDGVGSYVDKELSDRMYVPNPFRNWLGVDKTSERMFRVGDVLRYRHNVGHHAGVKRHQPQREKEVGGVETCWWAEEEAQGEVELEFLGRVDHQVKIRGYRIELEEIVNYLYMHESVGECLVVAKQPAYEGGEKYLVAYVILKKKKKEEDEGEKGGNGNDERDREEKEEEKERRTLAHNLRIMLEEKLPPYMVPSYFVVLDKWPLSPNGKIDRNALPLPTRTSHEINYTYIAPTNETERKLVEAFEEVLKMSPIGIEDDFFELGGNSLLGVSLIGSIEAKFGIRFPFSVIFTASTIRALATRIEEASKNRPSDTNASPTTPHPSPASREAPRKSDGPAEISTVGVDSPLVGLQTKGSRTPIFFIHPAFKSSVCYGALSFYLGEDQPFYGLEPRVEYDSIESMAADYVKAIVQAQPQGPYRIGGWSFGCTVAYEVGIRLEALGHKVSSMLMLDGRAPSYNDEGPIDLDALVMCILCRGAKQFLGFGVELSYSEILGMTPDQRLIHVVEKVLDHNGLDKISPGVAGSFFFRFQRDIKESELFSRRYLPQKKFGGTITLFRSMNTKPFLGFDDKILESHTLGWEQLTDQPLKVIETNSDHESVVFQPAVREVAKQIRKCLDEEL